MPKPSSSTLIPVIIIISIITGGLYFLFKPQADTIRQSDNSPDLQQEVQDTTPTEPTEPKPQPIVQSNETNNAEKPLYRRAPVEVVVVDPCLEAIKKLDNFFIYLDTQDYIKEYQFPNDSREFISSMVNKALSHPPAYDKMQSIGTKAKTGTHLYRTIGAQNLLILAKILANEPDQLETIFEIFYNWSFMAGQCPNRTYSIRPQLDQLYQYALFFVDTEDGKRYVNRRDSLTRLLTRYYALRVIKEAQAHHIDKYNIDLSSQIILLITDIESTDLLEKKTIYLKDLYALRDA